LAVALAEQWLDVGFETQRLIGVRVHDRSVRAASPVRAHIEPAPAHRS
jgi:hypothetical protein